MSNLTELLEAMPAVRLVRFRRLLVQRLRDCRDRGEPQPKAWRRWHRAALAIERRRAHPAGRGKRRPPPGVPFTGEDNPDGTE